jgi:hypothetical protein
MNLPARSWFLVGIPLALAGLLTFHPEGDGQIYDGVRHHVTAWLVVHIGLALGAILMAIALYQLVRGLTGTAASVTRAVLAPFVVAFLTWEGFTGIQTGLLTNEANGLPAGPERDAAAANIQDHFTNPIIGDPSVMSMIANGAWITAVVAAAIAFRRAGAGTAPTVLLCLATLFTAHSVMLGSIGLACFAGAALLVERRRHRVTATDDRPRQEPRLA